jgi:hypothetical protein
MCWKKRDQIIYLSSQVTSYKPHSVCSSHIARFSSGVCSTVVEGAAPADNVGGSIVVEAWGKGLSSGAGGAGWLVHSRIALL